MSFYMGETELQARRRVLSTLHEISRKVLEAARSLVGLYESMLNGDNEEVEANRNGLARIVEDVEELRRTLTRQLADVGTMILNREDVLRVAYLLEEMVSYIDSASFRIYAGGSYIKGTGDLKEGLQSLIERMFQSIVKVNELSRFLLVNPSKIGELITQVEEEEKEADNIYRNLLVRSLQELSDFKQLLVFRDIIERIERISDLALTISDMLVIISLRL